MLKQRRLEANLSQEQLAERAHVCEVLNISFIEANPDEILSVHRSRK